MSMHLEAGMLLSAWCKVRMSNIMQVLASELVEIVWNGFHIPCRGEKINNFLIQKILHTTNNIFSFLPIVK